ncbi:hypothetical protein B0J17DRAFT_766034 [Rhizoctonia solani]|nr:hypothetical protein B0J17DRAFT_766034 [Rhizoctonia solani]
MSQQNPDDLSEFRYWHKGKPKQGAEQGQQKAERDSAGAQERADPNAPRPAVANNVGNGYLLAAVSLVVAVVGLMYAKSG